MTDSTLAQRIQRQFEQDCRGPFPLDDVRKVCSSDPEDLPVFHGQLEIFLSSIAGYASRADRLGRRPRAEILEARRKLSQPFFEKHKHLKKFQGAITPKATPNLFRELTTAEKLRTELLTVIDEILS